MNSLKYYRPPKVIVVGSAAYKRRLEYKKYIHNIAFASQRKKLVLKSAAQVRAEKGRI